MKKFVVWLLVVVLLGTMVGCNNENETTTDMSSMFFDFNQYKDSDDIPDWTGEKLKLVKWDLVASPNSSTKGKYSTDDVVSPEIERVTGISYDTENSFDNSGGSFDSMIAKLVASSDFPDIASGIPDVSNLVEEGILWRLDELIEKYAPNIYKLFGPNSQPKFANEWNNQIKMYGGVYALPHGTSANNDIPDLAPTYNLTDDQVINITGNYGSTPYPFVYVREDILKMLYPDAYTSEELEQIYEQNGEFTKEQIFDVPITSPQDFVDMLYKIRDLNVKDDGRTVYPIFTHIGSDNWSLVYLGSIFGHSTSPSSGNVNYFSYYDLNDDEIKYTLKQDWYKEFIRQLNVLVRDNVASKEALIDTNTQFKEKLNSGRYAVTYGGYIPDKAALDGKYTYRKVYLNYKINTEDYLYTKSVANWNMTSLFKESLSEKEVIQVIRYFDFMASDPGQKLAYWGPRSAGLYTETDDGKLQYKDEALKNEICNSLQYGQDKILKYGLTGQHWPGYFYVCASKYHPGVYYQTVNNWSSAYNAAFIEKHDLVLSKEPHFFVNDILNQFPDFKNFWSGRDGFEKMLTKVFTASNDEEFDALYNDAVEYAEKSGLNEDVMAEFNKFYKEDYNAQYMQYVKK